MSRAGPPRVPVMTPDSPEPQVSSNRTNDVERHTASRFDNGLMMNSYSMLIVFLSFHSCIHFQIYCKFCLRNDIFYSRIQHFIFLCATALHTPDTQFSEVAVRIKRTQKDSFHCIC